MKIHLLMHLDGGNRGCEAITKSTAVLLKESSSEIFAYSKNATLDIFLGINKYCNLVQMSITFFNKVMRKIVYSFAKTVEVQRKISYYFHYLPYMKKIKHNDVYLSTGGDMMCYVDNEVIFTNDYLHRKGIKTILWGCSMGIENATPAKLRTLHNFSAIYARESLTYNYFKSINLKKVFLLPDPAFILDPQPCKLPPFFMNENVVGINVSNFILEKNSLDSEKANQVMDLIKHLLKNTDYHILLIPHVFWKTQDDKVVCDKIKSFFFANPKISVLKSDVLNYCELRYVISKCKFFVGARTHSVISAYSTYVPAIALGYSVKSRGIALDIGLPENLVVDFRETMNDSVLLKSFIYLENNEEQIRAILKKNIPLYVKQLKDFDFKKMIDF